MMKELFSIPSDKEDLKLHCLGLKNSIHFKFLPLGYVNSTTIYQFNSIII